MENTNITNTLYEYVKKNGKVSKRNFPYKEIGVPSYSTCKRKGIDIEGINESAVKDSYYESPKKCMVCPHTFSYEDRHKNYCSVSCSNKGRKNVKHCKSCEKELLLSERTYCSNRCQIEYQYREYIKRWLEGKETGYVGKTKQLSKYVRRYIYQVKGTKCSLCEWDERHPVDGSILTEIDHIDGKVENTVFENLRVLCPNCHSMTPTFRARNKNSGRVR